MTNSSEDGAPTDQGLPLAEFAGVFARTPGLYLVLDASFTIMAVNDAYCAATLRERVALIGRHLFEAFPDNPGDSAADGVQNLRASLLKVLKTCQPDRMDVQKYDVQRQGSGAFEERYWSPLNIPVLGADGYVRWIVHSVEDVTELMNLRTEFAAQRDGAGAQRLLVELRDVRRELEFRQAENAELRETLRRRAEG